MKKVVLGTGLIICGVLGILAWVIKDAIFFASPNTIITSGRDQFFYIAIIVLIAGVVLNVFGFLEKDRR